MTRSRNLALLGVLAVAMGFLAMVAVSADIEGATRAVFLLLHPVLLGASIAVAVRPGNLRHLSRGELWLIGLCVGGAFAFRIVADPFPADIRSTADMAFGDWHRWAAAYSAWLGSLFTVFPVSFDTAVTANVVLGALTTVSLYALVALCFDSRPAALAAAALYAAHPILARFAASDSAHVLLTFALLTSTCFACLWARRGGIGWAVLAAGWAAVAGNVRVEAVLFVPVVLFICLGSIQKRPEHPGDLLRAGLPAAALLCLPALVAFEQATLGHNVPSFGWEWIARHGYVLGPDSPAPLAWLACFGLIVLLATPGRRKAALAWLLALFVLGCLGVPNPTGLRDTNYRYFIPLMSFACAPAGVGLSKLVGLFFGLLRRIFGGASEREKGVREQLRRGGPVVAVLICALAVAANAPWLGFLHKQWTHQLEHDVVRESFPAIEEGCTIVTRAGLRSDAGLELSPFLSREVGRVHRWTDTTTFLESGAPGPCTVFYRSATCHSRARTSTPEPNYGDMLERAECREMSERFELEPIALGRVPALPYVHELHTRDPIPVGFYRVREKGGSD